MRARFKRQFPKPYLWLIRFVGLIVPRRLRADWRQEWEAELRHREALLADWDKLNWQSKLNLFWRSTSAFWDALWLQPQRWEEEMFQDLRIGLRLLRSHPGFTFVAVLALGLGIGATTLIFSVVNAVLLRPLPFPQSDRIVRIEERHGQATRPLNLSYATFLDLRSQTGAIEHVAASRFGTANLTDGAEPEQVNVQSVTANYFSALGITPVLGRTFLPEEDLPDRSNVAILSYQLWQRRYGADPNLIGKTIKVGSSNATVIGVMPPGFRSSYLFAGQYDLWTPLVPTGSLSSNRRSHLLGVIARLKPDSKIEQAQSELSMIANRIERENSGVDPDMALNAIGLQTRLVAPLRQTLIVFLCAVGSLLLIACANVANLLLARSASREKEMAIRAALGAGRLRLTRQLLTEGMLLASLGGAAGLLLSVWGIKLVSQLDPSNYPRINEVSIDWRVLGFSFLISMVTGVLFGLAPALQLPKHGLYETLKEGGRGSTSVRRNWLRQSLVVAEVALALALLIGAGLLINSFMRLMQVNRGFDPTNVLAINLNLPFSKYPDSTQQTAVLKQMLERVSAVPGVRSAGLISSLPFNGGPATDFVVEDRPPIPDNQAPIADIRIVDANYFRTMSIPLRSGRTFTEGDSAEAPRAMIINEELARRHWPGENPLGQRVTMKDWGPPLTGEIIGVVGDVKADGLDSDTRPMIYWPYPQFPGIFNNLVVRTNGDPAGVIAAVKSEIWAVDREQPLSRIQRMEEVIATSVAPRRFNMLLLGVFAVLALALSAIGIYGVISYTVAQRTHEIGIRLALGAGPSDVRSLVIRQGMRLVFVGGLIGLAGAFALTQLMAGLLFGIKATDPATFLSVTLLLVGIAWMACYLPARRATKVDPLTALRHE
ncbi:MAG: ABC transporter permease [Acidobacteria bacterium]|nr:ABC transporter permease [Acidobacteriota bacterium]